MLIFCLLSIVFSNSITVRSDKSLSYNRTVIISLLYGLFCGFNTYDPTFFGKQGIGLFGGLLYIGSPTLIFQLIIYILASIILIFTSFFPTLHPNVTEVKDTQSSTCSAAHLLNIKESSILGEGEAEKEEEKQGEGEKAREGKIEKQSVNQNSILNFRSPIFNILEYPLIILFIINGALFLMCTSDLISIFICIELQSYGLYIISTIYKDSELSTSGGLMYFLLGGLSSCFILLGAALLYANSGTTNLDNLYIINDITNASFVFSTPTNLNIESELIIENDYNYSPLPSTLLSLDEISGEKSLIESYTNYYIIISLIFITVGFLFKVSAAPFHFWSPDVYDSIPTVVTTFVAIIAKLSIFILLLEIVNHFPVGSSIPVSPAYSNNQDQYILNYYNNPLLSNNILLSSVLSLIIGTVLGLSQTRIKRLFAYSTISHIGFILLSLSINSVESIQAFFFYLAQYSFSNLNAFLLLICIGYTYHYYKNKEYDNLKEKINSPVQLIGQLNGYFYINPILCLSLAITLFSFTGIPPLIGFFGKMMVLSAAIDKGYIFMCLLAILTSVISAGYYLYIIKQLFFYKGTMIKDLNIKNPNYEIINPNPLALTPSLSNGGMENIEQQGSGIIILSDYLTISISVITLFMCLFILTANECLNLTCILALTYI